MISRIIIRFTDPFDVSFTAQENPMTVFFSFVIKLFGTIFKLVLIIRKITVEPF